MVAEVAPSVYPKELLSALLLELQGLMLVELLQELQSAQEKVPLLAGWLEVQHLLQQVISETAYLQENLI
jgi:hypothetical protein